MSASVTVRGLVRAAWRRWTAARWVESALLGGAVAGLTLAASSVSGAPLGSRGSILAALLSGGLAALTLAGERRRSPGELARRLDRRLGEDGALLTAWECEAGGAGAEVAALHVSRTRARLDRRRLLAAVSPPSPAFLAALALGAALALLAAERGGGAARLPAARPAAGVALARLAALADAPDPAPGEVEEALRQVEALVQSEPVPPEQREQALRALEALLAEPEHEDALERRALALAERLRAQQPPRADPLAPGSGEPALAGAPAERTMGDPTEEPDVSTTPPLPSAPAPAGRWWPLRHDAVVAGYLERTRVEREGRR